MTIRFPPLAAALLPCVDDWRLLLVISDACEESGDFAPLVSYRGLQKVGKKAAGRLLDGKEWSQFPEAP